MSLFESRLLAEGVRSIEGDSPIQSAYSSKSSTTSFEALLLERASLHVQSTEITSLFLHFKKLTNNLFTFLALLLFLCGGLAVNKMLFTDQLTSINFFWAFTLFFIPNIFMLFMWLLFFIKPSFVQNSSLYRLSLSLIKLFEFRFNKTSSTNKHYLVLFHSYFNILFGKHLGRYQLSKLTHLLWLSYFSGATLTSVAMLATHQVDFVWQTSILSSDSFQSLTIMLGYLPQQLGIPVPSIEQIQHSYLGAENLVDPENARLAWSSLLISSLFLYGLLPRFILFLLMSYQYNKNTANYNLDLSNSYYVQLRQLLKPNKTSLGITDIDEEDKQANIRKNSQESPRKQGVLPNHFYPIAIELSCAQLGLIEADLKSKNFLHDNQLVNVCDHQTQQSLLIELQQSEVTTVVIYVAIGRLPDRGLKRFIGQLTALPDKDFHLAMIVDNTHNKQRDSDWYQLANDVAIPLDNILHIETKGAEHE